MNEENKKILEKSFYSFALAKFRLNFKNGNTISTIWGPHTYSDNEDDNSDVDFALNRIKGTVPMASNTCEIMFDCDEKLKKEILEKYNEDADDPIGYLTLDKWLEIVNLLK